MEHSPKHMFAVSPVSEEEPERWNHPPHLVITFLFLQNDDVHRHAHVQPAPARFTSVTACSWRFLGHSICQLSPQSKKPPPRRDCRPSRLLSPDLFPGHP